MMPQCLTRAFGRPVLLGHLGCAFELGGFTHGCRDGCRVSADCLQSPTPDKHSVRGKTERIKGETGKVEMAEQMLGELASM